MKKLTTFGIVLTLLYLAFLAIVAVSDQKEFSALKPNELGDFIAGGLGPLAIFWLILSFLQQGKELGNSVAALHLQTSELKNTVEMQRDLAKTSADQLNFSNASLSGSTWLECRKNEIRCRNCIEIAKQLLPKTSLSGNASLARRGLMRSGAMNEHVASMEQIKSRIDTIEHSLRKSFASNISIPESPDFELAALSFDLSISSEQIILELRDALESHSVT